MSTVPFILEALRAQGLILLWVRRDEKSVLLKQVPSSLLWTAARNIWVQNHTETVTKADTRVMLTDALEEHSDLIMQKAHPSPLEFPSAPPFQMPDPLSWLLVTVPNLWPLLCWRVPPAGVKFMTPSTFEDHFLGAQGNHCSAEQVPHLLLNTDVCGKSVPLTPALAETVLPFHISNPQRIRSCP